MPRELVSVVPTVPWWFCDDGLQIAWEPWCVYMLFLCVHTCECVLCVRALHESIYRGWAS